MNIKLWNELGKEANQLIERAGAIHSLRCENADLSLQPVYDQLLMEYSRVIARMRELDPDLIKERTQEALAEANTLKARVDSLSFLSEVNPDDKLVDTELHQGVYRLERLLDQITVLAG